MGELIDTRKAYAKALVELGHRNPDVVALSADVSNSDHSFLFAETFPERFFNTGIAEQSLVDCAVGLALAGKIPFANTFSVFFATRAVEMIRTHVCYGRVNVKLMAAYGGMSPSFEGPTHHADQDLAMVRTMPGLTVVVPADPFALTALLPLVAEHDGPVYFRMNRNEVPAVYGADYAPRIGAATEVRAGGDLTIVACGIMVARALEAAAQLAARGIECRVIDMFTIKPLDVEVLAAAARETGAIVTAEEHKVLGGLGAAVAEAVSEIHPVPVVRVGIPDRFAETGPYFEVLDRYGCAVADVVAGAERALDLAAGRAPAQAGASANAAR